MESLPQPIEPQPQLLNPWLSIWTRPRTTIRQILDDDPRQNVLWLAAIGGIVETFTNAVERSIGDRTPTPAIILIALTIGPLGGIIALYIVGALLTWMGQKLGGSGSAVEVRAAIAWSSLPKICGAFPLLLMGLLLGEQMFTTEAPILEDNPLLLVPFLALVFVLAGLEIWSLVLLMRGLGEAHRFSSWRALGTAVLALLVVIGPILCIVALVILRRQLPG